MDIIIFQTTMEQMRTFCQTSRRLFSVISDWNLVGLHSAMLLIAVTITQIGLQSKYVFMYLPAVLLVLYGDVFVQYKYNVKLWDD
jgi:hypothetical protein